MSSNFQAPPLTDPGAPPRAWPPPRRKIMEPLVLAVGASSLKDQVGPDALREVLGFSLAEMTRTQGVVNLGPLWDILKKQPGFTIEKAAEPMARFKSFELSLGFQVQLPDDLASWQGPQLDAAAARAPVSSLQLLEALDPPRTPSAALRPIKDRTPEDKKAAAGGGARRLVLPLVLIAIGAGVTPFVLDKLADQPVSVIEVSKAIPLKSARILGDGMELTLLDDDWPKSKTRDAALAEALANAKAFGVSRLSVLDSKGAVRAIAVDIEGKARLSFLD